MNAQTLTITQRLEKLERQNRRLKFAGIVLLLVIGSAALMAAKPAGPAGTTVQATKFVLMDSAGKEVAILGMDTKDRPGLSIMDSSGKERAWLGFWGGTGSTTSKSSQPGVGFYDENNKERAWIGIADNSTPRAVLFDKDHKETWSTPAQ